MRSILLSSERIHSIRFSSRIAVLLPLLLFTLSVTAQITTDDEKKLPPKNAVRKPGKKNGSIMIDDTTKHPYSPKTVLSTTENDLFYNRNRYVPLDTSFFNFHRWTYVQKSNNFYKDLGNMGSALSPIYPLLSPTVGVTSGYTAYAPYYDSEEPHYFDTKSPYTNIYAVWGGSGRAITKIQFSRNVNSRWNFGFNYRPIWVDRQLQHVKNARQTISQYYDFYTTYKSKDSRYLLLMNYRRIRHRAFETGGVNLPEGKTFNYYFDPNAAIALPTWVGNTGPVSSEEYRSGIHLFQHYQLAKPFQVYNITDIQTVKNSFINKDNSPGTRDFFDFSQADSTANNDVSALKTVQSEAGIKGNAGPLFYDYYFKVRSYNYQNTFQQQGESIVGVKRTGLEKYVGARMALRFDSLTELSGNAELLLDGHYRIEGNWKSKYLDAFIKSSLSKPGLMQQAYKGSHNQWSNDFGDVLSQQLGGFLKAKIGPLYISPGATFTTLHNYIYFKEDPNATQYQKVLPYQSDFQILFSPELRVDLTLFKKLTIRTQTIASSLPKNDGNALQIPALFFNGQLSYEGTFFKGALNLQMGFDTHWQSTYYALGYAPSIQQFYVQQSVTSPAFPLVDLFLNAKLKRGRIFIKYQNIAQAIKRTGYMPTPAYPSAPNLLDFGFIILLFD